METTQPFRFRKLSPAYGGRAQVSAPIAGFLRAYQLNGGYTPGPLLLLFAIAGLAGSAIALALAGRRLTGRGGRERAGEVSSLAMGCLLMFTSTVGVLLISDMFEFSWRYQLPSLVMLPPAGALGAWVLWRTLARRPPATAAGSTPTVSPATEPSPV